MSRAHELVERAARIPERSRVIIAESSNLRSHPRTGTRFFGVHGALDGFRVRADWFRGATTTTSPLSERSRMLVGFGKKFVEDNGAAIAGGLGEALPALLAVVQACDLDRSGRPGPHGRRRLCAPRSLARGGSR